MLIAGNLAFPFPQHATGQVLPPYENDLLRLAEILGGVQYLHSLCSGQQSTFWSDQLNTLLDTEVTETIRRRKFAEHFNLGYRGYAATHRICTPIARQALQDHITEGIEISEYLTNRY